MPAIPPILACLGICLFFQAQAFSAEEPPAEASAEPASDAEANPQPPAFEPIALSPDSALRFATVDEGRDLLSRRDDYIRSLGPLEMQIRLRSAEPVDIEAFIKHLQQQVLPWEDEELARTSAVAKSLAEKLGEYEIPLPETVYLIRTTGEDESGAAYTRGAAIVLPRRSKPLKPEVLERLLAHELFHVISRHDPELRQRLYAIIGFQPCNSIELPEAIAPRRITNPDAPTIDYYVTIERPRERVDAPTESEAVEETVENRETDPDKSQPDETDALETQSPEAQSPEISSEESGDSELGREENERGEMVNVVPILLCDRSEYDPKRQRLFDYLQFRLMVIHRAAGTWRPLLADGQPQLIDGRTSKSYRQRIGENTNYIIHPDEILADNFVHMVMRTQDLKSPEIVKQMRAILQSQTGPQEDE